MKHGKINLRNAMFASAYVYLALPIIIFFLGWCKWYIGIPATAITIISIVLCVKEGIGRRKTQTVLEGFDIKKLFVIVVIIVLWVIMSGIGGYVWQNSDHWWRNKIFDIMVTEDWPVVKTIDVDGNLQERGIVYYIGFWLPAALIGKILGLEAGYAAQFIWAVAGVFLTYILICIWRKKISVWPLVVLISFSGLDAVGALFCQVDELKVFGDVHLEWWSGYYQYSSMTTQLFWVFNQAIPAWLVSAMVFFGEKPRNMIFLAALMMTSATIPLVGLMPFVVYYMISRAKWSKKNKTALHVIGNCWKNWASIQNLLGGGVIGLISAFYVSGNYALIETIQILENVDAWMIILLIVSAVVLVLEIITLVLKGCGRFLKYAGCVVGALLIVYRLNTLPYAEWQTPLFYAVNLMLFYALEVGVYLICLKPLIRDKKLYILNAAWLFVIPLITIGKSADFCMRASIPGLLLIFLWSIEAIDGWIESRKEVRVWILLALLLVGAITPWHEFKRTYYYTTIPYENQTVEENRIYLGDNFSGFTDTFYWKYVAKNLDNR